MTVKLAGIEFERVGVTIVNARWLLDKDGKIIVTLPEMRVEADDLGAVLVA